MVNNELIKTSVDDLLELLKKVNKISLSEAAAKLSVSSALMQSWVDFLVEEEIVGVEYKFTKPLIYLNKDPLKDTSLPLEEADQNLQTFKEDFAKRAAIKQIPEDKVDFFWKNHLKETLDSKKEIFFMEAKKRKLDKPDALWDEYINTVMSAG